jgi:hypothetical protein
VVPYVRAAAAAGPGAGVVLLEAAARCLPPAWFAHGAPPEAASCVELARGVAAGLAAAAPPPGAPGREALAGLARRLCAVLDALAQAPAAAQLAAAYGGLG